uniref:TSEN15 tRNA splicing endonuclease subunit n=1 Tax=Cyprinus carpio TaxID=7962 RepID=A0A8C2JVL1_CYPCA
MHLDVGDSAQVYAAFLVYMDLTEVRKWKEVVGVSCPELQAVLLEAREKEGEAAQMIFPLPSHRSIKHREFPNGAVHAGFYASWTAVLTVSQLTVWFG